MDAYCAAWKTFRKLSDENDATAKHVVAQHAWPKKEGLVIADIGCGDGRLVEAVVLYCRKGVAEVRLLDPDLELLNQAEVAVTETTLVERVRTRLGVAEKDLPEVIVGADVALMVHVVYLMQPDALARTFSLCPPNIPIYVVLDEPTSVFTELWGKTAPKYRDRARKAHSLLQSLTRRSDVIVHRTTIVAEIENPLLERADLQDAILSILCYADITGRPSAGLRRWVEQVVTKHTNAAGQVVCKSACYELTRHRPPRRSHNPKRSA